MYSQFMMHGQKNIKLYLRKPQKWFAERFCSVLKKGASFFLILTRIQK